MFNLLINLLFTFSKTFSLGNQEHFNLKNGLNKTHINFTYLVPSDQAWEDIKKEHASVYKVPSFLCSVHTRFYPHLVLDSLHGRVLLPNTPRPGATSESWGQDVPERHGQYNSLLSNILILTVRFQISSTETGVGVEVLRGPPLKVTTSVVNGGK